MYIVYSRTLFSKNPHPTETSQLICNTTQLTGFYTIRAPTERYFRTDHKKQSNYHNVSHNTETIRIINLRGSLSLLKYLNESYLNLNAREQLVSLYTYFIFELPLINLLALVNNK